MLCFVRYTNADSGGFSEQDEWILKRSDRAEYTGGGQLNPAGSDSQGTDFHGVPKVRKAPSLSNIKALLTGSYGGYVN